MLSVDTLKELTEMALIECKRLRLTDREIEVARLMAQGYSNRRIARMLSVQAGSVKGHTNNVYR